MHFISPLCCWHCCDLLHWDVIDRCDVTC